MRTNRHPLMSITAAICFAVSATVGACRSSGNDAAVAGANAAVAKAAGEGATEYSVYGLQSRWRDQRGDTIELRELAGRVQIVAMVYTNCQVTCPLVISALKKIEAGIPLAQRDSVGFVLVSLDPMRDTPGRLAEWAEKTRLDERRWRLLSGNDDAVRELAATLEVRYQRQPDGEVSHTNGITVLDRDGAIAHRQARLEGVDATVRLLRALLQ